MLSSVCGSNAKNPITPASAPAANASPSRIRGAEVGRSLANAAITEGRENSVDGAARGVSGPVALRAVA